MDISSIHSAICSSDNWKYPVMKRVLLSMLGACAVPQTAAADDTTALELVSAPGDHQSCPVDSPWSCSVDASDSCCYEGSNGLFLQTQFWDYSPATGPNDAWTLHGLWSDRCGGGYRQFCNPSWEISSAQDTLQGLGMDDLVSLMSEYWKNQGGTDNDLWTHEFNKHGTCMSTVNPSCYESGQPQYQNVGDFFNRTVGLYQELTTYEWLEDAGILPSTDKTWTVDEFSQALLKHTDGHSIYLGCDRRNAITEVWYFFKLKGSVADGEFQFIDSVTTSSCTDGFQYLPKNGGSGGGGGNDGDVTRGYINVTPSGQSSTGCLISDGSWYTSGTCATFRFSKADNGVHISSSKGNCGVVNSQLVCSSQAPATVFTLEDGKITYGDFTQWGASGVPNSQQRERLVPGSGSLSVELNTDAQVN